MDLARRQRARHFIPEQSAVHGAKEVRTRRRQRHVGTFAVHPDPRDAPAAVARSFVPCRAAVARNQQPPVGRSGVSRRPRQKLPRSLAWTLRRIARATQSPDRCPQPASTRRLPSASVPSASTAVLRSTNFRTIRFGRSSFRLRQDKPPSSDRQTPNRFAAEISCGFPGDVASAVNPSPITDRLLNPVRFNQVRPLSSEA